MKISIKKLVILAVFLTPLFVWPTLAEADYLYDQNNFFVDVSFDEVSRSTISATLRKVSDKAYFYIDNKYWDSLSETRKNTVKDRLNSLADEFDKNIYPKETSFWGLEPQPGVDSDYRVTILFENLKKDNGGYFNSANSYAKSLADNSNERDMIVINTSALDSENTKTYIAHEFQHLISFNQKELGHDIVEDVWLNELRSEYSTAVVGYDSDDLSSLKKRVQTFATSTSESLTEWANSSMNYAQVSIFGRYLVDHFGPEILSDTLKDKYAGMSSINNFLRNKKTGLTFFDIFKNWMIASFINDGSQNKYYGYLNEELKSLKTNPDEVIDIRSLDFYTLNYKLKSWRPYYSKININIPAGKSLKLSYQSSDFRIAYLDNLGRSGALLNNAYITNPGGLEYFVLMPINQSVGEKSLSLNMEMVDASNSSNLTLSDGALIKKVGESEIYVISGKYKRYLVADVIKMYGHLDQNSALEVDDATFNSFITANYVKSENNKKVYSVWPDGTKHWLNMSGEIFSASGRDWGSIFTINDSELNYYKEGAQIKK